MLIRVPWGCGQAGYYQEFPATPITERGEQFTGKHGELSHLFQRGTMLTADEAGDGTETDTKKTAQEVSVSILGLEDYNVLAILRPRITLGFNARIGPCCSTG